MASPAGYNPMRWDCEKRGCFNKKRRPKIEIFSDCFPNKCSLGDVDGIVEINGHALMLEWKTDATAPTKGQQIMYERMSGSSPLTVFLAVGDAELMTVSHFGRFHDGMYSGLSECDIAVLHDKMSKWSQWAQKTPVASMGAIKKKILELAFAAGLRKDVGA